MPSLSTNSDITLTINVVNTAGSLVDPDTIELVWWLGRAGSQTTVAQADLTHDDTGIYSGTVTPEDPIDSSIASGVVQGGPMLLYYEFRMTNPTYIERGKVAVSTSEWAG